MATNKIIPAAKNSSCVPNSPRGATRVADQRLTSPMAMIAAIVPASGQSNCVRSFRSDAVIMPVGSSSAGGRSGRGLEAGRLALWFWLGSGNRTWPGFGRHAIEIAPVDGHRRRGRALRAEAPMLDEHDHRDLGL